jgi:hypothetical protein
MLRFSRSRDRRESPQEVAMGEQEAARMAVKGRVSLSKLDRRVEIRTDLNNGQLWTASLRSDDRRKSSADRRGMMKEKTKGEKSAEEPEGREETRALPGKSGNTKDETQTKKKKSERPPEIQTGARKVTNTSEKPKERNKKLKVG